MHGTGQAYRFGPFELDVANCELRRDGLLVKLAPQPFTILLSLVSRAGSLVTREELRRPAPRRTRTGSTSLAAMTEYERGALGLDDAGPSELHTRMRRFRGGGRGRSGYARAYAGPAQTQLLMADYRAERPQVAYAGAKGIPRWPAFRACPGIHACWSGSACRARDRRSLRAGPGSYSISMSGQRRGR